MRIDRTIAGAVGIGALLAMGSLAGADGSSGGTNLLKNPGFEDSTHWLNHWTVTDIRTGSEPYYAPVGEHGGGWGVSEVVLPHEGKRAIGLYGSGYVARLGQKVSLTPGRYRLTVWASNQTGLGDGAQRIVMGLGERTHTMASPIMGYRRYDADFAIATSGVYEASVYTPSSAFAFDDLSLTKVADSDVARPCLYAELHHSTTERAAGVQYCLADDWQWVDLMVCGDSLEGQWQWNNVAASGGTVGASPVLRLSIPAGVQVDGFNAELIDTWRSPSDKGPVFQRKKMGQGNDAREEVSFGLPVFSDGVCTFGGFWVRVPSGKTAVMLAQVEVRGQTVSTREIRLIPIQPPARQTTPRRYRTVSYHTSDWKMSHEMRPEASPRLFALAGFNVWSDYGFRAPGKTNIEWVTVDKLHATATRKFGVKEFWPNNSSFFQTSSGYEDLSQKYPEKDMFVVGPDGQTNTSLYNCRYIAQGGKAWRESSLAAYQYTFRFPAEEKLCWKNTGYFNDSFEALVISYDPATLEEFARSRKIAREDVTPANLQGKLMPQWLSYNMELYTRVATNWAAAMRAIDPNVVLGNTQSSFGPIGSESLPLAEQMAWAGPFDYTMPQWYDKRYYGTGHIDEVLKGVKEKVYGKEQGGIDVIPVWHMSEGEWLLDVQAARFKTFDLASFSTVIKGFALYHGLAVFCDGKTLAAVSRMFTMLADVEDYYFDGRRADASASFQPDPHSAGRALIRVDRNGKDFPWRIDTRSDVRVHKLNGKQRQTLITVITHHLTYSTDIRNVGEKGELKLDLNALVDDPKDKVLVDHTTGEVLPLTDVLRFDTHATGGIRVLEIADREWVARHFKATQGRPEGIIVDELHN